MSHKNQKPLDETTVERLRDTADSYMGTEARISLTPACIFRLTNELLEARAELFRVHVCESVDRMLTLEERNDEDHEDLLRAANTAAADLRSRVRREGQATRTAARGDEGRPPIPYVEEFIP